MEAPSAEVRFAAVDRAVFAGVRDGEGVIVDSETAFYYGLNRTAAFLWETLQREREASAPDLVRALVARFDVEPPAATADVGRFLEQVVSLGLAVRVDATGDLAAP